MEKKNLKRNIAVIVCYAILLALCVVIFVQLNIAIRELQNTDFSDAGMGAIGAGIGLAIVIAMFIVFEIIVAVIMIFICAVLTVKIIQTARRTVAPSRACAVFDVLSVIFWAVLSVIGFVTLFGDNPSPANLAIFVPALAVSITALVLDIKIARSGSSCDGNEGTHE